MTPKLERNYREGIEDGIELCLKEAQRRGTRKEIIQRLQYFLGLVKDEKLEELTDMMGVMPECQT